MNNQTQRIALVGTGRMGANMARRLVDTGYRLTALYDLKFDVAESLAQELRAQGANCVATSSLAATSAAADIILTVVSDDQAMRALFQQGTDSLLQAASGKIFINCATLSPEVHLQIEKLCEDCGAKSLEACMASSIMQAREGTLYLMIAGSQQVFESVLSLLQDLSKSLRYIGPAGQAAKVKALVNMVMNINTAGLAEGLGLGAALGLDLQLLKEVFSQTGANSRVLETDGDDMLNRAHDCFFSAEHAAKDSAIANNLASAAGLNLPLSTATEAQYRKLVACGRGQLDKSAVAELTFPGRLERV